MPEADSPTLLLVFFFIVLVIIVIVEEIAVFAGLGVGLILLIVFIVGDEVEMDWMRLRNFEFRFALRATQNLALFDLVFIDIDFGGTLGAADHESILRKTDRGVARRRYDRHLAAYYIPRDMKSTPAQPAMPQEGTKQPRVRCR
jgi:hypothetical protein